MHSRMFRALGAAGAVGASLAFAGPALAASAPTLYVNGSTGNDSNSNGNPNTCRLSSNPCATIQHAIGEAPTTAKISVAAGTYAEQLTITSKNLTITGAGEGNDATADTIIDPSSLATSTDDPRIPAPLRRTSSPSTARRAVASPISPSMVRISPSPTAAPTTSASSC